MINNVSGSINVNTKKVKASNTNDVQETSKQPEQKQTAPFNNAYAVAFMGKVQYTTNEKAFIDFRDKFCEKLQQANINASVAQWEFYINSTPENANILNIQCAAYNDVFADKGEYERCLHFKENGISDKRLQLHVNQLLGSFESTLGIGSGVSEESQNQAVPSLSEKENEIAQKFNSFKPSIDGRECSSSDISRILKTEKDIELRKKAYIADNAAGDVIADDLIELVKMRNDVAKQHGYDNFYTYMVETQYGIKEDKLTALMNDLNAKSDGAFCRIKAENDEAIAKKFGIKTEDIRPWHRGYSESKVKGDSPDDYITKESLVPLATEVYTAMGWKIDEMPVTLDLFPRDNKNGHGFCFGIEAGHDARILANLDGDTQSEGTLFHELGHAMYTLGIPDTLPYLDQGDASSVMTESVAMLMESLLEREGVFEKHAQMPKKMSDNLEKNRVKGLTSFVKNYIFYHEFEKGLYENPDGDIKKLWYDLKQKYLGQNPPEELNNAWATVPHFLSHPGYMQNYLRAEVTAAQIYEAASSELGNLTDNPKTAEFFKERIFKYGMTKSEDEIIEIATGKPLSAEAFCRQFDTTEA